MLKVKIEDPRLLESNYRLNYVTDGSAAIDLRACGMFDGGRVSRLNHGYTLYGGDEVMLSAGFSMALPENTAALLLPRSGLGARDGIVLGNLIGVVDSDYRNTVGLSIWYRKKPDNPPVFIEPMMRIAQMMIVPVLKPEIKVVSELPETMRGLGGFGSTGVT